MPQLVFDLIGSQVRGIDKVDGPHFDRCLYILESLASVRTCNALVDIAQGDMSMDDDEATAHRREQARDALVELFDTLLSRVWYVARPRTHAPRSALPRLVTGVVWLV